MALKTIEHEQNCDDCKEIAKENAMIEAYRQSINQDFEKILEKKLEIRQSTLNKVSRLEKIVIWLIAAHVIELGLIGLIIHLLLTKNEIQNHSSIINGYKHFVGWLFL